MVHISRGPARGGATIGSADVIQAAAKRFRRQCLEEARRSTNLRFADFGGLLKFSMPSGSHLSICPLIQGFVGSRKTRDLDYITSKHTGKFHKL